MLVTALILTCVLLTGADNSGNRAHEPAAEKAVDQYTHYLKSSGEPNILSIGDAYKYYLDHLPKSEPSARDAAFVQFNEYYLEAIRRFNEAHYPVPADSRVLLPSQQVLQRCGLRILGHSGMLYLAEAPDFLYRVFGAHLSKSLRVFLKQRSNELSTLSYSDVGNSATFKDIAKRCLFWEDYLRRYQQSPLLKDANNYYEKYLSALLTGTPYTLVLRYGEETRTMEERAKILSVYEYILKKEPNSRTAQTLSEYIPILKSNDFSITPELLTFFEKNGLKFMSGYEDALGSPD